MILKRQDHRNLKVFQLKNLLLVPLLITTPSSNWYGDSNFCLSFKGIKKKGIFTPPNRINFLIVDKLDTCLPDLNYDFTLKDCLFGGAKLTKNADPNKYVCTGTGIRSICVQNFHYLMVVWVKMSLLLEMI